MLKKLILFVFLVTMSISDMSASAGSQSAVSTKSEYSKALTQNVQIVNEGTDLLKKLLGQAKQATPSIDVDIKAQAQKLESEIKDATVALQQERDELNDLNTFLSSIETLSTLKANILRYDTIVLPNKIRELYGIERPAK